MRTPVATILARCCAVDVAHMLTKLSNYFASDDAATAPARSIAPLASRVQREANILAYIDSFWLTVRFAIGGLAFTACMGRSPQGSFTPKAG